MCRVVAVVPAPLLGAVSPAAIGRHLLGSGLACRCRYKHMMTWTTHCCRAWSHGRTSRSGAVSVFAGTRPAQSARWAGVCLCSTKDKVCIQCQHAHRVVLVLPCLCGSAGCVCICCAASVVLHLLCRATSHVSISSPLLVLHVLHKVAWFPQA